MSDALLSALKQGQVLQLKLHTSAEQTLFRQGLRHVEEHGN